MDFIAENGELDFENRILSTSVTREDNEHDVTLHPVG